MPRNPKFDHSAVPEWVVRRDLAAAYRLSAHRGWDDLVWTHISAAVPGEHGHYLLNRFGLQFREVTASNLVKVPKTPKPQCFGLKFNHF